MAAPINIVRGYGVAADAARKEDILGLIEILTATENSIFNKLGKTSASDVLHTTLTDTLRSQTINAFAVGEAEDYSVSASTTPTRMSNYVEIISVPFGVSRTQQQIEHYHGENELARQTAKALKDWHNAAEFDLIRSALVTGTSGVVPKMNGIITAISKSTNTTAHNSGTVWSATVLKGLMKTNWDNNNGDVATDIYMSSYLKSETDGFTNKTNTSYTGTNQKEIINVVDIYETGFGRVSIMAHRYVFVSGTDSTARVLAINPDKLKVAFLERPFIDTGLARSGDYDLRAVVGKMTLEVKNQDSNWFASGFITGA